ncbi:flagellar type III secretion system pore protein FliP [Clostridium sp. 'White wine YQ']|uniref:flagellar type III secretion system pore protein FliP n=1 Tax=Clostridium sp. 'White wine YQ' TaxID=3027474 RepID=UPI0023662D4E|nr:flagellar type III secretion system pore protein FliP [Clostridium sp. 'White wine YQ']MDD7794589.1 flagellar type III secretion system pore protein FliP [Clostridium sp. 'White wine YQ']
MNKKRVFKYLLVFFAIFLTFNNKVLAAEPQFNVSVNPGTTPTDFVTDIKLLIFLTILTLLPSFIVMVTSFTRIAVVLSFLKNALGVQQAIPSQVMVGLTLFLTLFIMQPVYTDLNANALQPYMQNKITQQQAIDAGSKPLREFMLKQTRQKDLKLFIETSKLDQTKIDKDNVPLYVVVPAFVISELKTAFQIGFLIFLPFLIIDMVVASVLMSMGMFMLPPVMVSLPFKLLLFAMVDGWYLVVKSLIMSFS